MRKHKNAFNKQFGICVLVLALIVSIAGINKARDAEAEETISGIRNRDRSNFINSSEISRGKIMSSTSIYIENRNIVNIYPERPKYNIALEEKYQDLIWELCIKNDISYEFVLAVFYYESKFKLDAVNRNKDRSIDNGVSQLNSYYTKIHEEYAIKYCEFPRDVKFNVFNPDHNIRAGIGNLVYLRNFWKQKGVGEEFLIEYITGSFNMGLTGYQKYIKRTGKIEREYSKQVYKAKIKLETTHTL